MTFFGDPTPLRIALFIGLLEILGVFATWEGRKLLEIRGCLSEIVHCTPEGNIGKCTVSLCYSRIKIGFYFCNFVVDVSQWKSHAPILRNLCVLFRLWDHRCVKFFTAFSFRQSHAKDSKIRLPSGELT